MKKKTQHPANIDWEKLRTEFFSELTKMKKVGVSTQRIAFRFSPHSVFEWMKNKISC